MVEKKEVQEIVRRPRKMRSGVYYHLNKYPECRPLPDTRVLSWERFRQKRSETYSHGAQVDNIFEEMVEV